MAAPKSDRDDREADEEQDDVGDQRRPEDVGVADALVIEVFRAQPEQPSSGDEQHHDRRDDAEDDDPAAELARGPDDPRAGPPPSKNLLGIEAEGTHEVHRVYLRNVPHDAVGSAALEQQPHVERVAPAADPA